MKPLLRRITLLLAIVVAAGFMGAFALSWLFPKLATWSLTSYIPWPTPLKNATTIIERTEQVILSPEEGIERLVTGPRTAIVNVVATPVTRSVRSVSVDMAKNIFSGLLVTNDGLVAVYLKEKLIAENYQFSVLFSDSQSSKATFVAFDDLMNLAYFRTERGDTPSIAFTNSTDIRPGRRFIALAGSATGDGERVITGVVSEYARTFNLSGKTVASSDAWEGVFFLDREINSSFSSGAVVAMNGELIGLIGTTAFDGGEKAFVLPANALRQSLERLSSGVIFVPRQDFGTYYLSLTPAIALSLGLSRDRGAFIYTPSEKTGLAVISGSLAERMGLRFGDIITSVNSEEINLDRPLSVALSGIVTGQPLKLSIERAGKTLLLEGVR